MIDPRLSRRGLAALIAAALPAAVMPRATHAAQPLRFAGSTSILPIITDAANAFRERNGRWNRVNPALPDAEIVIYTSGGGSSAGVRAAIDRTADVGMANRDPRPAELERLGAHRLHAIGIDGIAIAAHRDNPLFRVTETLTAEQVAKLFSGEFPRYSDFDPSLPDIEIVLLTRDASGGNTQIMQQRILGERSFARNALQQSSTGTQLRRLEANPNAIAYISSGVIWRSEVLRAFSVDGVPPTQERLIDGSYTLQRRMLLIVPGEQAPPMVQAFLDFLLSEAGQAIVARHDYVPAVMAPARTVGG
jgi:phosphate transport system substrate-binding protein